jgi:chromosome segregation ATPase
MEKEAEMLEQKISLYEKKIQDYTERYESLCGRLQEEDIHSSEFKERRERWSSAYEQKASDSIQKHRHFRPEAFRRAVHKTDYALSHAVYLAGRTEYLVSRMQKMADEMSGNDRQRSP